MTEADVDSFLDAELERRAVWQAVERPAEIGDRVVVDINGAVGDETIMDNQDWELTLREDSGWLPGFDETFVGMAAGEEKAFSLTYPEDSSSRYKGQTASFQTTVKEVRARVQPEVTDELIKEMGDYETAADFRTKKLEELQKDGARRAEAQLNEAAVEALVEKATFTYPPAAVENITNEMLRDLEVRVGGTGYSLEDFLRLQGTSVQRYHEQIRPAAERRLKGQLVIQKVGELEQIQVSDDDTKAELERMIGDSENEQQAQVYREVFGSEQGLHLLHHDVVNQRTLARLRDIVSGNAPELPAVEPVLVVEEPVVEADTAPAAEIESIDQ